MSSQKRKLPDLQQRAVDLLPELLQLVKTNPNSVKKWREHPAIQSIKKHFRAPHDRIMGAILTAYFKPLVSGEGHLKLADIHILEQVIAGDIYVYAHGQPGARVEHPGMLRIPMIGGTYAIHHTTQEVLQQQYDDRTGKRLAASMAVVANPLRVAMEHAINLHLPTEKVAATLKEELEHMKKNGVNPLAATSILEIGGNADTQNMPQTSSFDYTNIVSGKGVAKPQNKNYVSLDNQPNGMYDYVITANALSPIILQGIPPLAGACKANGDLFCCCANKTKRGGKIIHLTGYDMMVTPPVSDYELHQFAGVHMDEPSHDSTHINERNALWVYTKTDDRQITAEEYSVWGEQGKFALWDSMMQHRLSRRPAI